MFDPRVRSLASRESSFLSLTLVVLSLSLFACAKPSAPTPPTACTMDAMMCPDGSAVGRQGPNCEFAPCPAPAEGEPVACTMDAKVCPDGSAVGRTGPNCEFEPCPGESAASSE